MSERKKYSVEIDKVFDFHDIPLVLTVKDKEGGELFICCIYRFNGKTGGMTHLATPITEKRLDSLLQGEMSVGDVFGNASPVYRIDDIICESPVANRTKMRFSDGEIADLEEYYIRQ